MAIDYDKLLALKIPDAEHTYTDKDTILYALGVGLGHDPLDLKQLDFVYEKNLKTLPTFAAMLGYPGFWMRDLDTGIDWVRLVNGEQAVFLHQPLKPTGTVIGKTRVLEVIDKGQGKGALVYAERKVIDKASGALIATTTQTTFCRADGGFGGPPRESPPVHQISSAISAPGRSRRQSTGCPVTATRCTSIRRWRRPQAFHGRSCMGSAPSVSSATRCSKASATMTRHGWRRLAGGSRRRCSPAKPSAPKCGATAMSSASARRCPTATSW
jgi:hypothetical protein